MTTVVLAILCLVVILALYIGTGGWKSYGGLTGILTWMRVAGLQKSNPKPNFSSSSSISEASLLSPTDEVEQILDGIYQEFTEETAKIREELEQFKNHTHAKYDSLFETMRSELQGLQNQIERFNVDSEVNALSTIASDFEEPFRENAQENSFWTSPKESLSTFIDAKNSAHDATTNHFEVLDYLYTGMTSEEISESTGAPLGEVERVRQLMAHPLKPDEGIIPS